MSQRNGDDAGVSFRITNPTAHTSGGSGRSQQASTSQGHRNGYGRQYSHTRYESDSESEEDDHGGKRFQRRAGRDESITGIDHKGIRSSNASKKEKALVIPTAPNKDFRRAAIELRAKREGREVFVPGQAPSMQGATAQNKRVLTDADRQFLESESNVQRIGDKLASGGIRIGRQTAAQVTDEQGDSTDMQVDGPDNQQTPKLNGSHESQEPVAVEEDADALALRELLADKSDEERQAKVHIIPQAVTEEEAYALDVADRPDTPDMDAYQRVPIEDFGAALLRGMGGGTKKAKPKVEAWVPKPRTALLGIGAKSREETFGADWVAQQDGKKGGNRREQMRFMPLQKVDRPSASATPAPLAIQDGKAHASSSRRGRDEIDYSDDDKERRRRKHRRDSRDRSPVSGSERDSGKHRRRDYSRSPREADRHGSSRRPHEERERDKDRRSDRERHRDRDRDRDRDKYDSRDRSGRNSREKDYTSSRSDYDKDRDRRRDR